MALFPHLILGHKCELLPIYRLIFFYRDSMGLASWGCVHIWMYSFPIVRHHRPPRFTESSVWHTLQTGKPFAFICLLPVLGGLTVNLIKNYNLVLSFYNFHILKHIYMWLKAFWSWSFWKQSWYLIIEWV